MSHLACCRLFARQRFTPTLPEELEAYECYARLIDCKSNDNDARRSTLDARRSTLDARRSTLDARRSTLDARRSTLDAVSSKCGNPQAFNCEIIFFIIFQIKIFSVECQPLLLRFWTLDNMPSLASMTTAEKIGLATVALPFAGSLIWAIYYVGNENGKAGLNAISTENTTLKSALDRERSAFSQKIQSLETELQSVKSSIQPLQQRIREQNAEIENLNTLSTATQLPERSRTNGPKRLSVGGEFKVGNALRVRLTQLIGDQGTIDVNGNSLIVENNERYSVVGLDGTNCVIQVYNLASGSQFAEFTAECEP